MPGKRGDMMRLQLLLFVLMVTGSCNKDDGPPPFTPPVTSVAADTLPPQYGVPFAAVPDTRDIAMYEVNIRAFSATHDLQGVTARLDSIRALGINVIWLMPIYPVGKVKAVPPMGSPYAVQDYTSVNPAFGDLSDLRALVGAAHSRGMAVILDWVADHTSWDNSWIKNTSWYQQNADGQIISPPGQSWSDVAALNYTNTDMREAMIHAMRYWVLAANIDGYRCDYADGPPADFWRQAADSLKSISPSHRLIMLAETADKDVFSEGFEMNYAWDYYTALKNVFGDGQPASGLIAADAAENALLPKGAYKLRFTTNHDEDLNDGPPVSLFQGNQGSMAAFVLTASMGGVPLVYNGQEVGDPEKVPIFDTSTIHWDQHPEMVAAYKEILGLRNESLALRDGVLVSYATADVAAFEKSNGNEQVLVIVNVRNIPVTFPVNASLSGEWKDGLDADRAVNLATQLSLPAFGYRIFIKN